MAGPRTSFDGRCRLEIMRCTRAAMTIDDNQTLVQLTELEDRCNIRRHKF